MLRQGWAPASLYEWIKKQREPAAERQAQATQSEEVRRLNVEIMGVHPSGFYAWRAEPNSEHQREDERLQGLLKQV